jgi:hypothetical protein
MASATTVASQQAPSSDRSRWGAFHLVFAAVAVLVLLQPLAPFGLRVLLLVVAYNAGVVVVALRANDAMVLRWWCVLAPMSVVMVLPDWFLSAELGVLVFPDTGSPYIGTVPLFMAGMWVVALLPIMLVGHRVERAAGLPVALVVVVIAGLALFTAAEWLAPSLPLWHPQNVPTVAGVAPYVLLPEAGLTLATYLLVRNSQTRNGWATAAGVVAVPFLYLGMLASSYQFL